MRTIILRLIYPTTRLGLNNMQRHTNSATIRNLLIFSAVAVSAGWIGWELDHLAGSSHILGPGQLFWLVMPFVTAVLLRTFGGDGWKDAGLRTGLKANALWYAFAFFVFPVSASIVVVIGLLSGLTLVPYFSTAMVGALLKAVIAGLPPSLLKNIFEEFAWRGYLAPRITSLGMNDLAGHALVGVVWAAWHVPYYLFFLDRPSFVSYTSLSFTAFFPMMFAGVIAMSLVYGEIRLLTQSVWPLLLLHTVSNAVGSPLLLGGLIKIAPGAEVLVSPGPGSVLSIILYSGIGAGLYRFRNRKVSGECCASQEKSNQRVKRKPLEKGVVRNGVKKKRGKNSPL